MRRANLLVAGTLGAAALIGCNQILDIDDHELAPAAGTGGTAQAGSGNVGGASGSGASGGRASGGTGGASGGTGGTAGMEQSAGAGADGGTSGTAGGSSCGNGDLDDAEDCDDGNNKADDGCSAACAVEDGWTCDASGCDEICGDELVVGAEAKAGGCDDNNDVDDDGCTNCRVDDEYVCSGTPSECARTCGDGKLDSGEECDDDNSGSGDGCFACAIETGYECDTTDEPTTCSDIDECATNTHDCDDNATCNNAAGSWDCTCNQGFEGSGQECTAVNECDGPTNCDANASCSDTPSAPYVCTCNQGFVRNGLACAQISCDGLGNICGPSSNESCCDAPEVTGGTFFRTYNDPNDKGDEATISTFHLDRFEITTGRFRKFVQAWLDDDWRPKNHDGKHRHLNGGQGLVDTAAPTQPAYESGWNLAWEGGVDLSDYALSCNMDGTGTWSPTPNTYDEYPMNCINWFEAYAFCIWDGGFLPSEAEWGYAATGGVDQRKYPWVSTALGCEYANGFFYTTPCNANLMGGYGGGAWPVGTTSTTGDGKYGQADLAGNEYEWVLDWSDSYVSPCLDCASATGTPFRRIRGGAFSSTDASLLETQYRNIDNPGNRTARGARCARP